MSGRFVAAMTITPSFEPKPSIRPEAGSESVQPSCPPPKPAPHGVRRRRSSIKTIDAGFFFAVSNGSLTLRPTPTYISTKSEPISSKTELRLPGDGFGKQGLTGAGGRQAEFRAVSSRPFSEAGGVARNLRLRSSFFSSSQPATSLKYTLCFSSAPSFVQPCRRCSVFRLRVRRLPGSLRRSERYHQHYDDYIRYQRHPRDIHRSRHVVICDNALSYCSAMRSERSL